MVISVGLCLDYSIHLAQEFMISDKPTGAAKPHLTSPHLTCLQRRARTAIPALLQLCAVQMSWSVVHLTCLGVFVACVYHVSGNERAQEALERVGKAVMNGGMVSPYTTAQPSPSLRQRGPRPLCG